MTMYCGKLCSLILAENFGSIVQTVGNALFKYGTQPLGMVQINSGLSLPQVKESLCVLIKHGFVTHEQNEKGRIDFTLHTDRIILVLRYSRFMFFVKNCCALEGQMILEEVLRHGYNTASEIIMKVYKQLEQSNREQPVSVVELKEKFELLLKNRFLVRSLMEDTVSARLSDKPDFDLPELNLESITKILDGGEADPGDKHIYWRVNFDTLIQDHRDEIIVQATTRILDENAGELMRQLLFLMYIRTASWADTSNPIPFTEIKDAVKKLEMPALYQYVDQYLRLIEEDSCQFLKRFGDSGGGQFSVNMKEAVAQLAWATIENIVLERFGSKAARIFRLVRSRQFVEQEQIQQLAMIPAKEAKHLTYTLGEENYLQIHEVKKPGIAAAPNKGYFLYHIDLNQVVRMEIDHCYHALYNMMYRRDHESALNQRIIEKQIRAQAITATLKEAGAPEEQLADIAASITPSEKQQLDKVQMVMKKLSGAELQTEETLFLLTMYLRYHR